MSASLSVKPEAKSGECQPKSKTEQNMRGLKPPKSRIHRDCQRAIETEVCLVNQMNRIYIYTSNFLFNVFHIKVILMRKRRLAPNQALHVTSMTNLQKAADFTQAELALASYRYRTSILQ